MTDYSELVERLRKMRSLYDAPLEAANAIETQAKEIEELERVNKNLRANNNQHHDRYWEERWRKEKAENEKLAARIAELEAENVKMREALKPLSKIFIGASMKDDATAACTVLGIRGEHKTTITAGEVRTARAAEGADEMTPEEQKKMLEEIREALIKQQRVCERRDPDQKENDLETIKLRELELRCLEKEHSKLSSFLASIPEKNDDRT
jgi:hypothetical protein